ncbi:hypothetical protein MNBD_GAMMA06-603 [hydrothermal vent metagenome]|uniref:Uncharacterized protein n=1 Tax=hydrothermal vent metagenome TaxID=652676 RepID=A0A3B0WQS1_9ZZZZ
MTRKYSHFIIILTIFICAIALRGIHINADTPSGLSWSAGLYVDEGYKTLSPRNLILFGKTHWHAADTYPGWMNYSPITQWSVYAAFKNFGISISSARLVPIIYFSLFILLYIFFMFRRHSSKIFYLGLVLLASDATLFTFSRVALFEMPISFFIYAMILPLSLYKEKTSISIYPLIGLFIGGIALTYLIKLSLLIYIFPVLAAASISFIVKNNKMSKNQLILFSSAFLIAILAILGFSYDDWSTRLNISPQLYVYSVIENPLLLTSPAIIIAGTLCAAHAIAYQSNLYLNNLYRLSLICMVLSAPFILSLFSYGPLRYYLPFVPAYILLIIEWFSTSTTETSRRITNRVFYVIGMLMFSLAVMYALTALKLSEYIQIRFIIVIGLSAALIVFLFRHQALPKNTVQKIMMAIISLSILQNIYFIGSFISNPRYDAETMRKRLSEIVKSDEVIAGGWAPFLTLGTPIKSIYASSAFNPPEALKLIQPNYFILSNTPVSLKTFERLNNDEQIIFGSAITLGKYNDTLVTIYPLSYNTENLPKNH